MQTKSNVWIVLHPGQNTIFQTRLENLVTESGSAEAVIAQPTRVHALLFMSYFDNWRWFLQDKGEDFAKVRPGTTVKYYQHILIAGKSERLFAADIGANNSLDISFERLQYWRDLEDRVMPLSSMLRAKLGLLDALEQMSAKFAAETANSQNEHGFVQTNFFRARKSSVEALMASAIGLQKRIHGVLNLVSFESLKVS
jgi:hypothetical protein